MSNPNPLQPQGSLLEQNLAGRSRVKWAVICVLALHLVGLAALLMQGCKRQEPEPAQAQPPVDESWYPPVQTNLPPAEEAFSTPEPTIPQPEDYGYTSPPPSEPVIPTRAPGFSTQTPTAPSGREYVVVAGDTFYDIGKKMGVSTKAIADANPNVNPNRLQIGQRLVIPAPKPASTTSPGQTFTTDTGGTVYKVKSGDTLSRIASQYGTTVKALRNANNLTTDLIRVGQTLKIPAAPAPEPVPPTIPPTRSTPPQSF